MVVRTPEYMTLNVMSTIFMLMNKRLKPTSQDAIRLMRTKLGKSQEQLARELDLSVRTVARYESDNPPTGGSLLPLISYAEGHGVEEAAAILRGAYLNEMRGVWLKIVEAQRDIHELMTIAEEIAGSPAVSGLPLEQRAYLDRILGLTKSLWKTILFLNPYPEHAEKVRKEMKRKLKVCERTGEAVGPAHVE